MSQVNFFMLPSDTQNFLEMILGREDTTVLPGRFFSSQSPEPICLPLASDLEKDLTFLHRHLGINVFPSPVNPGELSGPFSYDYFKSPVIEFDAPKMHNNTLINGRIYAKIGWLEPVENNRIFRSWYSSIERWLKKNYLRVHQDWWVAPAAAAWSKEGGYLALGNINAMKVSLANHQATQENPLE